MNILNGKEIFTEGKALHFLRSVTQCVKLSL